MADMVTKPSELSKCDLSANSAWQTGIEWMTAPSDQLPKSQPLHPATPVEEREFNAELFTEVHQEDADNREVLLYTAGEAETDLFSQVFTVGTGPTVDWKWVTELYNFRRLG
jgi:hypothetical protein